MGSPAHNQRELFDAYGRDHREGLGSVGQFPHPRRMRSHHRTTSQGRDRAVMACAERRAFRYSVNSKFQSHGPPRGGRRGVNGGSTRVQIGNGRGRARKWFRREHKEGSSLPTPRLIEITERFGVVKGRKTTRSQWPKVFPERKSTSPQGMVLPQCMCRRDGRVRRTRAARAVTNLSAKLAQDVVPTKRTSANFSVSHEKPRNLALCSLDTW